MSSEVDDEGEKHVILCRVILGKCEKIEAGSKQSYPSAVDFDTGVDDLNNPKWYVVWMANMNSHILPECVVSYKSSDSLPGKYNFFVCVHCDLDPVLVLDSIIFVFGFVRSTERITIYEVPPECIDRKIVFQVVEFPPFLKTSGIADFMQWIQGILVFLFC